MWFLSIYLSIIWFIWFIMEEREGRAGKRCSLTMIGSIDWHVIQPAWNWSPGTGLQLTSGASQSTPSGNNARRAAPPSNHHQTRSRSTGSVSTWIKPENPRKSADMAGHGWNGYQHELRNWLPALPICHNSEGLKCLKSVSIRWKFQKLYDITINHYHY